MRGEKSRWKQIKLIMCLRNFIIKFKANDASVNKWYDWANGQMRINNKISRKIMIPLFIIIIFLAYENLKLTELKLLINWYHYTCSAANSIHINFMCHVIFGIILQLENLHLGLIMGCVWMVSYFVFIVSC